MAIAAIWARISTEPQQSLASQVARAKAELEKRGYFIPHERILKVDWTSLDLFHCPQFQELRRWILSREIQGLGILDRDRLNAIGLQRLIFLSECKEQGVELVICQGPPILDEPEGQLVELALAIGKERQVLRAQQGSRDALRERATVKGLPTTCQAPYGYDWDDTRTRLVANGFWENRALIVSHFLEEPTIKGVRRELHSRGILSPKGKDWWPEPTIWLILADTVNYGEYRALRRENIEPKARRGNTYGKTSSRKSPGIRLPNIVVEKPIITKAQHEWIVQRLEQNRLNSKRNGHRDYLLRGLIHYEGDNLRYYGRTIRGDSWCYIYSPRGERDGNPRPYLPGRKLEAQVETMAREVLTSHEVLEQELGWQQEAIQGTITKLEGELRRLDRQENANRNAEVELVGLRSRYKDRISDEAFERQLIQIETERKWIAEQRGRVSEELSKLRTKSASLVGLEQLREQVEQKLESAEFADRRFVLEALGTRIIVTTEDAVEVEFAIPTKPPKDAIALSVPLSVCPRYLVVPKPPLWLRSSRATSTPSLKLSLGQAEILKP
ncbi:MAG: recombinase family protein [Desulfobacterales bacterium]|nr:recombinase family protein [Desulfobacterales bacterium]